MQKLRQIKHADDFIRIHHESNDIEQGKIIILWPVLLTTFEGTNGERS